MISLLIGLVIFALVAYVLWWLINQFPLPQPIKLVITVLFVLICVIVLLNFLPVSLPHGRYF